MGEDDATIEPGVRNGNDGALAEAAEELGTTAQQVRRAAAALAGSGRVGPGDAARGAAEAIERARSAAAGTARAVRRAEDAARKRPWAVVGAGLALGAGVGALLGRPLARRRAPQPETRFGEAFEVIWKTASEAAGRRGGGEARQ